MSYEDVFGFLTMAGVGVWLAFLSYRDAQAGKIWTSRLRMAAAVAPPLFSAASALLEQSPERVWLWVFPAALAWLAGITWMEHRASDEHPDEEEDPVITRILPPRPGVRTKRQRRLERGIPAPFAANALKTQPNASAPAPRLPRDP